MVLFNPGGVEAKITFTTRCTARCTTCLNHTIRQPLDLGWDAFQAFIAQILNVEQLKNINFYSIGESYLHPHFIEMVEWALPLCRERHIATTIVTNGSAVTKVPKGIDNFFISFNAGRKDTYERITGLSFDNVVARIKQLGDEGEFRKAKNAQIHMLAFEANQQEVIDFINTFSEIEGITLRVSYKFDNQQGKTIDRGLVKRTSRAACDYLTNMIVLYPNGDIVLCSHDFQGSVVFGNIGKESLEDVLREPKRMALIGKHNRGIFPGLCRDCNYNLDNVGGLFKYYTPRGAENCKMMIARCLSRIANRLSRVFR